MKKILLVLIIMFTGGAYSSGLFEGGESKKEINGKSSVHVFKNGKFTWTLDGQELVVGDYVIKGSYLIVEDLSGPRACLNSPDSEMELAVGIYQIEMYENKAYLSVVSDNCAGRQRGFLSMGGLQ